MSVGANTAVSDDVPVGSVVVAAVAVPPLTAAVAIVVVPLRKVTEPAAALGVIVAVSVTEAPCAAVDAGLAASDTAVAVAPVPESWTADHHNRFVFDDPKASIYWLSFVLLSAWILLKAAVESMIACAE